MTLKRQSRAEIYIREANIKDDAHVIENTLRRYLTPGENSERFKWLYTDGPHGSARTWLSILCSGEVIGSAAAFPRQVYVEGQEETAWVFGDFCLSERYRSLGPALQLQKACLNAVEAAGVNLWFDFPSASMSAVYRRLKISPSDNLLRLAKLLRVDREVAKIIPNTSAGNLIHSAANHLLAFRDRLSRHNSPAVYSLHKETFGEEFTRLASENHSRAGIVVKRDAEYLNWRYWRNPLYRHEILVARCKGNLVAYAIFLQSGMDATLVDLFCPGQLNILYGLLHWLVNYLRKRGALVLSAPITGSHPLAALLMRRGFRIRESSPVVMQNRRSTSQEQDGKRTSWLLMAGDRDS